MFGCCIKRAASRVNTVAGDLLPVDDALARILAAVAPLPPEIVPLTEALGRVTADPVIARRTQPPVAVSAMDGYAVRGDDVGTAPTTLTRIGTSAAGNGFKGTVEPGQCVRIFTGAPVPQGADTIVIQEDTASDRDADGATVTVRETAKPGAYVRPAGLDFSVGDTGVRAGKRLTARDIGLAAGMNVPWISVHRRPRVAILATGDEIVRPGEEVGPDRIVSSNGYTLAALVRAIGGEPVDLGIAPDDAHALRSMARGARGADVLVTTGGASVGDHDLVQSALGSTEAGGAGLGSEALQVGFWRIAMRPGKPLIFGHLGDTPMLGLPGNPVSTVICAVIFLKPMLERMIGLPETATPLAEARLGRDLAANDQRQDYLRAKLEDAPDGSVIATPFPRQDSSMMSRLAAADSLIVRPPFDPARAKGDIVQIMRLSGDFLSI
jgi:molybdopterin molybdotransferase